MTRLATTPYKRPGHAMRMTTEEYFATPESVLPQELIYGEWHVADAPFSPHQRAVGQLYRALHDFVEPARLGEVWVSPLDVVLDAERAVIVQPDVLFVSNERALIVQNRIYGAPDLVIEVLSPNPRVGKTHERLGIFARYGVRECWLVHLLGRRVEVLSNAGGEIVLRRSFEGGDPIVSDVLPGFDRTPVSILGY